jgi:isopentenyl-diphosphate delta-isomerase
MSNGAYPPDSFELIQRKTDHIKLTHQSRTLPSSVDLRFNYEPLFFKHPDQTENWKSHFLGFDFDYPIWISSMTGGTEKAQVINTNLAKLACEFNLGMGLGSCRSLLESSERLHDFKIRKDIGSRPLFANIGFAQLAELVLENRLDKISDLIHLLEANGLIIHLNPLQEWFQPGGDRYQLTPVQVLETVFDKFSFPIIIKEVGQGIGPESLKALLNMPIAAIEFGAFGGTNFSQLESLRSNETMNLKKPFIHVGHTASEMVEILNSLPLGGKEFIISGGIQSVLDGYALKMKLKGPSVIGMASAFLEPAQQSYSALQEYFLQLKESLIVARDLLTIKKNL